MDENPGDGSGTSLSPKLYIVTITTIFAFTMGSNVSHFEGYHMRWSTVQSLSLLGHQADMMDDPAGILFQSILQEAIVSSSSMARMSTHCLSSTSSADQGSIHLPRLQDDFGDWGCCGTWHAAWIMWVSISWHLPEEVPVGPQRSGSCSTPRCSCAPNRRSW